jgi:hypothetical protein
MISRRVTARFHKRARTASRTPAPSPGNCREESDERNLPVTETPLAHLVRTPAPAVPTSGSTLSAYLRDARARAEQVLRDHPRSEGNAASTCQLCMLAYPCDAVRAAEDVIAISTKLELGKLRSSKALLEFMTDLVDLGAADRGPESSEACPRARADSGQRSHGLIPH